MSDQHKLAILISISRNAIPGIATRLSFNSLSKALNLSKPELDVFLFDLNKRRFISQYSKKGVDGFTVVINQTGLDAVQDETFI